MPTLLHGEIIEQCVNRVRFLILDNPPRKFLKEEGANVLFLFSVITRLDPQLETVFQELATVWRRAKFTSHVPAIIKTLQNHPFPLTHDEIHWLNSHQQKSLKSWGKEWMYCKTYSPFDKEFDQRSDWRVLTMCMTFGFLQSPSIYQSEIEPWAVGILERWRPVRLRYQRGVVDPEPIYWLTHLIFCSTNYGLEDLNWSIKIKEKTLTIINQWIKLENPVRNIEPLLELGISKILLGGDASETPPLLQLWNTRNKVGQSRFKKLSGTNAYHSAYHIDILVALYCLLDSKSNRERAASKVRVRT